MGCLRADPAIGRSPAHFLEPDRHFSRDGGVAVNDARQAVPAHAEQSRPFRDGKFQGFKTILPYYAAWMRWVLHGHIHAFLMVINKINVMCVTIFKPEYYAPIAGNRDTPEAL